MFSDETFGTSNRLVEYTTYICCCSVTSESIVEKLTDSC